MLQLLFSLAAVSSMFQPTGNRARLDIICSEDNHGSVEIVVELPDRGESWMSDKELEKGIDQVFAKTGRRSFDVELHSETLTFTAYGIWKRDGSNYAARIDLAPLVEFLE